MIICKMKIGSNNSILQLALAILTFSAIGLNTADTNELRPRQDIHIGFVARPSKEELTAANTAVEIANQEHLPRHNLRLLLIYEYDSDYSMCESSNATEIVTKLYRTNNISAIFGRFCNEALETIAEKAASWDIPLITESADAFMFRDKLKFTTLTRTHIGSHEYPNMLDVLFNLYSWWHLTIIVDNSDANYEMMGMQINAVLRGKGYASESLDYNSEDNPDYRNILQKARDLSRIIVISAKPKEVKHFLQEAWHLGFIQSGEFVFLHYDLEVSYEQDETFQNLNDSKTNLGMFDALLRIVPLNHAKGRNQAAIEELQRRIRENSQESDKEISLSAGTLYDSIMMYVRAVILAFREGTVSIRQGKVFVRKYMWGEEYEGITGTLLFNAFGDRKLKFSIQDLNMANGQFETVAYQKFKSIFPIVNKNIHWPVSTNTPPADEPKCGFKNDHPDCQKTDRSKLIATVVGYGALAISFVIVLCLAVVTITKLCRNCLAKYETAGTVV